MTPAAQMEHEQLIESLRAAREKTLAKLGTVSKNVIGRDPNKYIAKYGDPRKFFWPSSVTGTIRLVWRENSVMLVTDGISDPWDKELHPAAPPGTFDYELAVEAPNHAFASLTEAAVFSSWMSGVLITTTDWMIAERVDLVGRLIKFDCATVTAPPIEGLESLLCPDGTLRGLIG